MYESIDDLTAPWMGNGVELARRALALADEMEGDGEPLAAQKIREVIRCEHNPLPGQAPQLGVPLTLRPAVPPKPEVGS